MTRAEFLAQLRAALSDFSAEEREDALNFYEEYFNEAGPANEAAVLAELGSPAKVARIIRANCPSAGDGTPARRASTRKAASLTLNGPDWRAPAAPVPPRAEETQRTDSDSQTPIYARVGGAGGAGGAGGGIAGEPGGGNRMLWLILLIATCPIWGGVLLGLLGAALGLIGGMCGVAAAGFATMIAGFVTLGGSVGLLFHSVGSGIMMMGLSMLCVAAGAAITAVMVWLVTTIAPALFRALITLFRRIFGKMQRAEE